MENETTLLRRICMVGIRGIGKTTLITSILPKLPWIDYLIGSSILRQVVGDDFIHFDQYSDERKYHYRELAIQHMKQRQNQLQKDILVDGHTTLYNPESKEIEYIFTEMDCEFFTDLIYYNAPVEIVLNRRRNDLKKKRIVDNDIIQKELIEERKESIKIAEKYRMGWYEVKESEVKENTSEQMQENLFRLLCKLHDTTFREEDL